MKIYLDLLFITNYIFDFLILLSTSLILKRNIKIYKILLGAFFGSLTLIILFIRMNQIELFLYKLLVSIIMILVTFNFKNIKYTLKNLYYLYIISIILGGFLTFINNTISYGVLFKNVNNKLNVFSSILLSIILLIIYFKETIDLKTNYNKYYKVNIYFNNKNYIFNAFLDTGNKLIDPYKRRPIILVKEEKIKNIDNYLYVPYKTISGSGILKCIKADKIYIENIGYKKKFLIGLTNNINIDNVDCILNERLLEG